MAHLVEQMFSVVETPWHKLGRVIEKAPTVEEGIRLAGLDWQVNVRPVFTTSDAGPVPCKDFRAMVRSDNGAVLSVRGLNYHPLQNIDAFKFFQPILDAGEASLETAGSLREGRTVWVLAKINRDPIEVVKGDLVNKYILLSNGHDGSMAVRVGYTPVRVVCNNTLGGAIQSQKSQLIRLRHSKSVTQNLEAVREVMNVADATFLATAEKYQALTRYDVNQEDIRRYVETVFEFAPVETLESRKRSKDAAVQNITKLFETSPGAQLPGVRGTAWGLYNAVTYFITHEAGRSDESRLNSQWFGGNLQRNERALESALQLVAA